MAGNSSKCPDCDTVTVSLAPGRAKLCAACYTERRRQSRERWRRDNREQERAAIRAYKEVHREEIRAKGRIVIRRDLVCTDCGEPFQRSGSRGRFPKWCPDCRGLRSAEIAAQWRARHPEQAADSAKRGSARRRAAAAASIEKVSRKAVFERDGWTCQICHDPVDRDAAWPDPKSPSLDHIHPLSKGGDHTYANTQLACLRCNIRKSDRIAEVA